MATWGDLLQQIVTTLNRDNLTDVVQAFARGRITHYSRLFTYATPVTETMNTVIGQGNYDTPDNLVGIKYIRLDNAGVWNILQLVDYEWLLLMDTNVVPTQSIPSLYAVYDAKFRLFQVPDLVYTLELTGNGKVPIPANDGDSNFWTQGGFDLIHYSTVAQIRLLRLKDPQGAQAAAAAAEQERLSLMTETVQKSSTMTLQCNW